MIIKPITTIDKGNASVSSNLNKNDFNQIYTLLNNLEKIIDEFILIF